MEKLFFIQVKNKSQVAIRKCIAKIQSAIFSKVKFYIGYVSFTTRKFFDALIGTVLGGVVVISEEEAEFILTDGYE